MSPRRVGILILNPNVRDVPLGVGRRALLIAILEVPRLVAPCKALWMKQPRSIQSEICALCENEHLCGSARRRTPRCYHRNVVWSSAANVPGNFGHVTSEKQFTWLHDSTRPKLPWYRSFPIKFKDNRGDIGLGRVLASGQGPSL